MRFIKFQFKSIRKIADELIKEGLGVINRYSHGSVKMFHDSSLPATKCFDDPGVESNIKYYGNRVRSRMREMFNLVSFGREVGDKRV